MTTTTNKLNIPMAMPKGAMETLNVLKAAGFQAYFVGGCVRDLCLNRPYQDIDITTDAIPDQVIALFKRVIPTGVPYGTVTVLHKDGTYEVTTYRQEIGFSDGRRPDVVAFSKELNEDLSRRDFTINAMALGADGQLTDPFGGFVDLEHKQLRAVGDPEERFEEDRLRKLRAIRFAAQLDFEIEPNTFSAIKNNPSLAGVSVERIKIELDKMLLSSRPDLGLKLLQETGLLAVSLPEVLPTVGFIQHHPAHLYDVFTHTLSVVANAPNSLAVRWAALLHDIGKPETFTRGEDGIGHFYGHQDNSKILADQLMTRLKFPNNLRAEVLALIGFHMLKPVLEPKPINRFIHKVGEQNIHSLLQLMRADAIGTGTLEDDSYYNELEDLVAVALTSKVPMGRAALKVNGEDLMTAFPELAENPKQLKALFEDLVNFCLEAPEANTEEALLLRAQVWLDSNHPTT